MEGKLGWDIGRGCENTALHSWKARGPGWRLSDITDMTCSAQGPVAAPPLKSRHPLPDGIRRCHSYLDEAALFALQGAEALAQHAVSLT